MTLQVPSVALSMSHIMSGPVRNLKNLALHEQFRNEEQRKIKNENSKMLKRLVNCESSISRLSMMKNKEHF